MLHGSSVPAVDPIYTDCVREKQQQSKTELEPKYLSSSIKGPSTDKVFVLIMYEILDSVVRLWKEVCVEGEGRGGGGGRGEDKAEGGRNSSCCTCCASHGYNCFYQRHYDIVWAEDVMRDVIQWNNDGFELNYSYIKRKNK